MGMYNEVFMRCPKCRGMCVNQIGQVTLGFGEFDLVNLDQRDDLTPETKQEIINRCRDLMFRCDDCDMAFEFKPDKELEKAPACIPASEYPDISNQNCIAMYFHCSKCLKERPRTISPKDFSQVQVGWTVQGFQVWCNRHNCNIIHMDFQGRKHPANTTA